MSQMIRHVFVAAACVATSILPASAASDIDLSLKDSVAIAVDSNPAILQAISNREAIDFELTQARGLYLPRVDLEGRTGGNWRDNSTTRANGDDDNILFANEIRVVVQQLLFDGFGTIAEIERQASRVDAAAQRIMERSELVGLDVVEAYLDVNRQFAIQRIAAQNTEFHEKKRAELQRGFDQGAITRADVRQAEERLDAAKLVDVQVSEAMEDARIRFFRLVGLMPGKTQTPPSVAGSIPTKLEDAIATARSNNPTLKFARADLDTAYSVYKGSKSTFYPKFTVELDARAGDNLNGIRGRDNEARAMLVMRYNLFNGGIDSANVQEQLRRIDEARNRVLGFDRSVEEIVRTSWNALDKLGNRIVLLEDRTRIAEQLLSDYQREFSVGVRSLLDILDTQNAFFNARVALVTAQHAEIFEQHRLVAGLGGLLQALDVAPREEAISAARAEATVPATPASETQPRRRPWRYTVLGN